MKWGEFKAHVEANGGTDEMELCYRDMNFGGREDSVDKRDVEVNTKDNEILLDSRHFDYVD